MTAYGCVGRPARPAWHLSTAAWAGRQACADDRAWALLGGLGVGAACNGALAAWLAWGGLALATVAVLRSAQVSGVRALVAAVLFVSAWQGAALWWAGLAVKSTGLAGLAWGIAVVLAVVLAQALTLALSWMPLRLFGAPANRAPAGRASVLIAWCAAFGAFEALRELGWWGNGYASLSLALLDTPGFDRLVSVVGGGAADVAAVALVGAGWAAWPALTAARAGSRRSIGVVSVVLVAASAAVAVSALADARPATDAGASTLRVVALQVRQDKRGAYEDATRVASHHELLRAVDAAPPGSVVVTPETYFADPLPERGDAAWESLRERAAVRGVHLLVGMPVVARDDDGWQLLNGVVHLAPGRHALYAKERLVPGAEYLPAPAWFGGVYERLFDRVRSGQAVAPPALRAGMYVDGRVIGLSICHEFAFGRTMLERARGADLIVNVSDDSWIGSEAYRAQMQRIARLRALETGLPVLRVPNAAAVTAHDGQGVALPGASAGGEARVEFMVPAAGEPSPYAAHADVATAAIAAAWFGVLLSGRARRPRHGFASKEES